MADTSELDALALDLGKAGRTVTVEALKVVAVAAGKVAQGMREDFTGIGHAPHIPRAIDYDVRGLAFEVGVNKAKRQGGLGNVLAFGTSKNPAVVDHTASLQREIPSLLKYLAEAGVTSLEP